MRFVLRRAERADVDAIAAVWYAGWRESHLGHVPDTLLAHRRPDQFRARVPELLDTTTVATVDGQIAGFIVTNRDEIEQLYVASDHRGSSIATALLEHGEQVISAEHELAFLAVVDANSRARRFYERNGWHDAGPFEYLAWTPDGPPAPVPCRRYEKQLRLHE